MDEEELVYLKKVRIDIYRDTRRRKSSPMLSVDQLDITGLFIVVDSLLCDRIKLEETLRKLEDRLSTLEDESNHT